MPFFMYFILLASLPFIFLSIMFCQSCVFWIIVKKVCHVISVIVVMKILGPLIFTKMLCKNMATATTHTLTFHAHPKQIRFLQVLFIVIHLSCDNDWCDEYQINSTDKTEVNHWSYSCPLRSALLHWSELNIYSIMTKLMDITHLCHTYLIDKYNNSHSLWIVSFSSSQDNQTFLWILLSSNVIAFDYGFEPVTWSIFQHTNQFFEQLFFDFYYTVDFLAFFNSWEMISLFRYQYNNLR